MTWNRRQIIICRCFLKVCPSRNSAFESQLALPKQLGLLEGEFDPPEEAIAAGGLASGREDAKRNVTAPRQLDGVADIGGHEVICIAIAKLRLETREELFLAALPGDVNFHAGDLSSIAVQYDYL